MAKRNLERKGFILLTLQGNTPPPREVMVENQDRNLEAGSDGEGLEECCILASSVCFLIALQNHLLSKLVVLTRVCVLQHLLIIKKIIVKKIHYRLAYRQILWRHLSQLRMRLLI